MAIALSKEKIQAFTGLNLIISFVTLMIVNSLVILLANALMPGQVVLGTYSIPFWWAIYHSMLKLSLAGTFVIPFVALYEWKKRTVFTSKQWMITYLIVNIVAVYGVTRFATQLGLGVSAWWVVLVLAVVLDVVQGMGMMAVGKYVTAKYLK